jgi:hypothetical protein
MCEREWNQKEKTLAGPKVAMLLACSKDRGCVSGVSCARLDPKVDARFRPGFFWNDIQVNYDPNAQFMKGDSAKILAHELYIPQPDVVRQHGVHPLGVNSQQHREGQQPDRAEGHVRAQWPKNS